MTRPNDYRLMVPEGWFRIDLEPGTREKSVAALAERQFRGVDNAPHLKQEARQRLLRTAQDAFRNGGIELYVSLQTAEGFPLSAALVVTLTPPHRQDLVVVTPARLFRSSSLRRVWRIRDARPDRAVMAGLKFLVPGIQQAQHLDQPVSSRREPVPGHARQPVGF